ncbi:DUF6297 family protein [Nonomuraea pusilla]|uniref:DUF6297 family protein n=1 Tax=Nonomuraea pusilla TaxID=46177 RepID=UPI0033222438
MRPAEADGGARPVKEVRAFIASRGRTPAGLLDRYVAGFGLVMGAAVVGRPIASLLGGLAGATDPSRAGAGTALVLLACAGYLALTRAAGPVSVSGGDASWLLLSPLDRRGVLARPARLLLAVAVAAGLLLGVGLAAVLGAPDHLVWRLLAALVVGVSATLGGMALAVLAQVSASWQSWVTAGVAVLVVLALVAASGQARPALSAVAHAPPAALGAAAGAAALACGLLVRRAVAALGRIPARALLAASTRAGHVATAAVRLDPGALTWIAEDNHWRARKLRSRRWPSLPGPLALAWQDWLRLARRPGRLALIAGAAALPAVLAQAGAVSATAALGLLGVLAGALAAASSGTAGARRDGDNPSLARLTGVGRGPALAARALLPALLAAAWAAAAFAGLALTGTLPATSWLWGPAVAPALAAGALRMARRGPVDHSMPIIDTPGGAIPTGPLFWALTGLDVALLGCLPAVAALLGGRMGDGSLMAAQALAGVAVLAAYVLRARRTR